MRSELEGLREKVRLLLVDRKVQKQEIDAQKAEISTLRSLAKNSANSSANSANLEQVVLHGELNELRRELEATKTRLSDRSAEVAEKDKEISSLHLKCENLIAQNAAQTKVIDSHNSKSQSGGFNSSDRSAPIDTFESEFAALNLALGQIDSTVKNSANSPLSPEQKKMLELEQIIASRDREISQLSANIKRLEALAFSASDSEDKKSAYGGREKFSNNAESEARFLRETSEEQARTIQLQKSTIGSLKEEVELLNRQLGEEKNNASINAEKQKKIAANQRSEAARIAEQEAKLNQDRAEFAKHLREFKDMRKELIEGNAQIVQGGGVSKSRYRLLRSKRDKLSDIVECSNLFFLFSFSFFSLRYKRKDYRKGHDINAMQKRLLQNVELLEVEDSQSTSEISTANSEKEEKESVRSNASNKSVQLVHDSSSEHADSE